MGAVPLTIIQALALAPGVLFAFLLLRRQFGWLRMGSAVLIGWVLGLVGGFAAVVVLTEVGLMERGVVPAHFRAGAQLMICAFIGPFLGVYLARRSRKTAAQF
jgi:hypothetical protein